MLVTASKAGMTDIGARQSLNPSGEAPARQAPSASCGLTGKRAPTSGTLRLAES